MFIFTMLNNFFLNSLYYFYNRYMPSLDHLFIFHCAGKDLNFLELYIPRTKKMYYQTIINHLNLKFYFELMLHVHLS